ncbi:hypothetical protein Tco_0505339 [Tanacetum coccineum]
MICFTFRRKYSGNGYSQKDKNEAKTGQKPSMGLERAWKTEAKGIQCLLLEKNDASKDKDKVKAIKIQFNVDCPRLELSISNFRND